MKSPCMERSLQARAFPQSTRAEAGGEVETEIDRGIEGGTGEIETSVPAEAEAETEIEGVRRVG